MNSSAAETDGVGSETETSPPDDGQAYPHPPLPPAGNEDDTREQQPSAGAPAAGRKDTDLDDSIPAVTLKFIGSIVAPTTLVTALLFYFGVLYAVGYYRYFGVNFTVLDLPMQGLLILSASTAIVPLAVLAIATLVALWLYRLPTRRLFGRLPRRVWRGLGGILIIVGLILLALTAIDAFLIRVYSDTFAEARGVSLAAGVLGLGYAAHIRRSLMPDPSPRKTPSQTVVIARWASRFVLVSVGLFWAVGSYAIKVGASDAQGLASDLECVAEVTLYSEKSLNLETAGVREERTTDAESAYGFRYPGLKLIPQSGQQYLLIPADWSPAVRPAILLTRDDSLRLEFLSPLQQRLGNC